MSACVPHKSRGSKPIKYLIVGGINTIFGYFASVGIYYALIPWLHTVFIVALINVICISFSFVTYKVFVFKSRGSWWGEYWRCYVVYGGSAVIGIVGLWFLVDGLHIPFWLAQAVLMFISIAVSYLGHDRYTFKNKEQDEQEAD